MADVLTVCAAVMVLFGFSLLLWFIRRLGILEIEAAMMPDHIQRPKADPQPMVEVKNPFKLAVSPSCTLGCVEVIVSCIYPCCITCHWNVKKQYLDKMVYESNSAGDEIEEADGHNVKNLQTILEENCETLISKDFTDISSAKKISYNLQELVSELSAQSDATNNERQYYDLVVTMELTEEHRKTIDLPSSITAMLTGIELKRQNENFKPCLIQQFIQTSNSKTFKLKKLFLEEPSGEEQPPSVQEQSNNLCIVCQMLPISRALIPCGHACLCSLCFDKIDTCPMCRQPVTSSFVLGEEPNINRNTGYEFSEILRRMNPLEIIRGIYSAS